MALLPHPKLLQLFQPYHYQHRLLLHVLLLLLSLNERNLHETLGFFAICQTKICRQYTIMRAQGWRSGDVDIVQKHTYVQEVLELQASILRSFTIYLKNHHEILLSRIYRKAYRLPLLILKPIRKNDDVLILRRFHRINWSLYGFAVWSLAILPLTLFLIPNFEHLFYILIHKQRSSLQREQLVSRDGLCVNITPSKLLLLYQSSEKLVRRSISAVTSGRLRIRKQYSALLHNSLTKVAYSRVLF